MLDPSTVTAFSPQERAAQKPLRARRILVRAAAAVSQRRSPTRGLNQKRDGTRRETS